MKKAKSTQSKVKHKKQLPIDNTDASEDVFIDAGSNNYIVSYATPDARDAVLQRAIASQQPFMREAWNEGNWNVDRPQEYVDWSQPESIITMCWNAYLYDPIVGNVIDLMTDFSIEGVEIQHPNKSVQSFLKNWWMLIKGNKILNNIFHDVFRAGICMVQKRTAVIDKTVQDKIAKITGELDNKQFTLPKSYSVSREIPQEYFTYDPRSVRVYGDETVGSVSYYVTLDKNSTEAIYGGDRVMLEEAVKNKLLVRQGFNYESLLPKDKVHYLAWRKGSYCKYGLPFTTRILESLLVKRKFLNMLRGASDHWLSAIRLWKLGYQGSNPEMVVMPSRTDYAKLAKLLKSAQPGASMDILWNFGITLEEHYAPVEKVFSSVPLDNINREIKYGLGVPDVLIDGSGGNFSNSFLAIKTLVERLEYARELVMSDFLLPELRMLSESLGFRRMPIVKWGHMNLRDETTYWKLLLQLRDRKLISKESILHDFDHDWEIESTRLQSEELQKQPENVEDPFKDHGPFFIDNPPIAGGGGPGVEPSARGRPSGKTDKNSKRRNSSPKGQKTVGDVSEILDDIMYTEAPAKLDRCQKEVYQDLVDQYKKDHGKAPSVKKRKEFESSSWAICRSKLNL